MRTLVIALLCISPNLAASDWPQFRGPNSSGVLEEPGRPLPIEIARQKDELWSVDVAEGISSPVTAPGRIYITGLRGKQLLTFALDRQTGKLLWEREAPASSLEEVHATSSPASSTPACDARGVVAFFGSVGLLAYDADGKEEWRHPLGPFKNHYGEAGSPVIAGDRVLLNCDQDEGSFLIALDRRKGALLWRRERPEFPRGYATPVLWQSDGSTKVLVAGTLTLKGYALETGEEVWSAGGLARIVNPTPVLGEGQIFVSSFAPGGDTGGGGGARIAMPPYPEYLKKNDRDGDARLVEGEVPDTEMKNRFRQLDANKDGFITQAEWENMARIFEAARNSILALRPDGEGKGGLSRIWSYERAIPYVPSPLYYRGLIYLVKDGGIFTILDAKTGELRKQGRLPAGGNYYASPIGAQGKIFIGSLDGELTVLEAGGEGKVLAKNVVGARIGATPAVCDGRLLVRIGSKLSAFGAKSNAGTN